MNPPPLDLESLTMIMIMIMILMMIINNEAASLESLTRLREGLFNCRTWARWLYSQMIFEYSDSFQMIF